MITEDKRIKLCFGHKKKTDRAKKNYVITYRGRVWLLMIVVCTIFWGGGIFFFERLML